MLVLAAFLISVPGVVDCNAYGDSMQDEVACWRQSHQTWESMIYDALARIMELERVVEELSRLVLEDGRYGGEPMHAADFGAFSVAVPAGWIVEVSGGEPRVAGVAVPASAHVELPGVSTLVMTHPATDEDAVPVTISVTVAPRVGNIPQHITWEDGIVAALTPHLTEEYGGSALWEDRGSARLGDYTYLREGSLEIDEIMAYRSATYTVFDGDEVYYIGLSAPPHVFGSHMGLLDAVYSTFRIN